MGIKDLIKIIRSNYSDSIYLVKLEDCKHQKIAIDSNLHFRKYWSIETKDYVNSINLNFSIDDYRKQIDFNLILKNTINKLILLGERLISFDITPVFVFDGVPREQKKKTIQERTDEMKYRESKLKELIEEYNSKILTEEEDYLESKIKHQLINTLTPPSGSISRAISSLKSSGFPSLKAQYFDAEKLCCSLYIEGKVNAVFSKDSDCIPLGCLDLYYKIVEDSFEYISVIKLLELMEITFEELIDFCILLGCDFNKRIKGNGPKKCLKLIREFSSIDGITSDVQLSNHIECREIFEYTPSQELLGREIDELELEYIIDEELNDD
jgi:flap endonuclease-1